MSPDEIRAQFNPLICSAPFKEVLSQSDVAHLLAHFWPAIERRIRTAVLREYAQRVRDDTGLIEGLDDDCCRNYGNALARWLDSQADVAAAPSTTPEV